MSSYTKTTNFTTKDNLTSGYPAKVIKGAEFDVEFNNIQTAVNSKANTNNAALTGTTAANALTVTNALSAASATIAGTLEAGTIDGGSY
jgi:hypothetical protein